MIIYIYNLKKLSNDVTISIYRNVWKADIDIRKVYMITAALENI